MRSVWVAVLFVVILLGFNSAGHALTAEEQELHDATASKDLGEMQRLIRRGVDVDAQDSQGRAPLHLAVSDGQFHTGRADILLKAGADVNVQDNRGRTPLHYSAKKDCSRDCRNLITLINYSADVNVQDNLRQTPLFFAVTYRIAWILMEAGAYVDTLDNEGRTPLQAAEEAGKETAAAAISKYINDMERELVNAASAELDLKKVRRLLSQGADVNWRNGEGSTALHAVLRRGLPSEITSSRLRIMDILLKAGARVDLRDNWGQTVLHTAAYKGYRAAITVLLEAGANVHARDNQDRTALQVALEADHENSFRYLNDYVNAMPDNFLAAVTDNDLDLVERFLANGVDVDVKGAWGNTALHLAAGRGAIVTVLLDAGADLEAKNLLGNTALHLAAMRDDDAIATVLLDEGADPDAKNLSGNTPLHLAAKRDGHATATVLLGAGADPEAKNQLGNTPLHLAAMHDGAAIATVLLDEGADLEAKTPLGKTPLHLAAGSGAIAIATVLLDAGADTEAKTLLLGNTPLHLAAMRNDDAIATVLLDAGADLEAKTLLGKTPLHLAAGSGHLEVAELMLAYHGDGTLVGFQDQTGDTALHLAAQSGDRGLVELLVGYWPDVLDRGNGAQIDPNNPPDREASIPNDEGKTPRQLAQDNGHTEIAEALNGLKAFERNAELHAAIYGSDDPDRIKALFDEGASIETRSVGYVNTPLHSAAFAKRAAVAEFLIQEGASTEARNAQGNTPLHIAALMKDAHMVAILLNAGAEVHVRNVNGQTPLDYAILVGAKDIEQQLLNVV